MGKINIETYPELKELFIEAAKHVRKAKEVKTFDQKADHVEVASKNRGKLRSKLIFDYKVYDFPGKVKELNEQIEELTSHLHMTREEAHKGYEFLAEPKLDTPLETLEKHGTFTYKTFRQLPKAGIYDYGYWRHVYKTHEDMGFVYNKFHDGARSRRSPIGRLEDAELDKFIAFLIEYRKILESDQLPVEKVRQINGLAEKEKLYSKFIEALKKRWPDFPESYFYQKLEQVPSIGRGTAKMLFQKGITTLSKLGELSEDELQDIPGIGDQTASTLKEYLVSKGYS